MNFTKIAKCFYKAAQKMIENDGIEHAGYLTFLAFMSLFPFLIFFISIATILTDLLYDRNIVEDFIINVLLQNISSDVITSLQPQINEIITKPSSSVINMAIIGMVWTASSIIEGLRTVLNKAYDVTVKPHYIKGRLLSILHFLCIIGMLTLLTTIIIATPALLDMSENALGLHKTIRIIKEFFSSITNTAINICAIAWMYVMIPNKKQEWSVSFLGAIIVHILWSISTACIRIYIKRFSQMSIIYGSLEGTVVSMIFFYVIGICFIYGAELNHQLSILIGKERKTH